MTVEDRQRKEEEATAKNLLGTAVIKTNLYLLRKIIVYLDLNPIIEVQVQEDLNQLRNQVQGKENNR
jgi:hypothetical protein